MAVFGFEQPGVLGAGRVGNRYMGTQRLVEEMTENEKREHFERLRKENPVGEAELDEDLERAIDRVGRDKVFARARAVGWSSDTEPPKWVWQMIVAELETQGTC